MNLKNVGCDNTGSPLKTVLLLRNKQLIRITSLRWLLTRFQKNILFRQYIYILCIYVYTQKNGAVSKVNKTFISHLTQAERTPSAAATVQVSHALLTVLQCVHPAR
jgi:hypothetical protein